MLRRAARAKYIQRVSQQLVICVHSTSILCGIPLDELDVLSIDLQDRTVGRCGDVDGLVGPKAPEHMRFRGTGSSKCVMKSPAAFAFVSTTLPLRVNGRSDSTREPMTCSRYVPPNGTTSWLPRGTARDHGRAFQRSCRGEVGHPWPETIRRSASPQRLVSWISMRRLML